MKCRCTVTTKVSGHRICTIPFLLLNDNERNSHTFDELHNLQDHTTAAQDWLSCRPIILSRFGNLEWLVSIRGPLM